MVDLRKTSRRFRARATTRPRGAIANARISTFENNDVEKAALHGARTSKAEAEDLKAAEEAGKSRAKGEDPRSSAQRPPWNHRLAARVPGTSRLGPALVRRGQATRRKKALSAW